jgi:hypothetical protein
MALKSFLLSEKAAAVAASSNEYNPAVYRVAPEDWEPPYPYDHGDVLLSKPVETDRQIYS